MSVLLFQAVRALGPDGHTFAETASVAKALLGSGDEEVKELLDCRKDNPGLASVLRNGRGGRR